MTGLVATAFTHRNSRAGDPDLHTHVAVANKAQSRQGKWLAIDGRVLYAATVAASETYNTALERHLGERLGLRFAARPESDSAAAAARAVREVVGVDARLLEGWSSRRRDIDARRAELAQDFQARTGRPPTRREAWALAQQATLETRQAKHEPRTLGEQRAAWAAQAAGLLGSRRAVERMVSRALAPQPEVARPADADAVADLAGQVVAAMEAERATWGTWHLQAEAQRRLRAFDVPPGMVEHVADLVVGEAVNRCVPLSGPTGVEVPDELRRSNGSSAYELTGTQRWTSTRVLAAEERLLTAATRRGGRCVDPATVEVVLQESALEGRPLNAGQAGLVRDLAGSGARLQLALAPAGTGKTTALRVLARAWTGGGGNVIGLAPSAAAASVLGQELDGPTDTLAKLVWSLDHPGSPQPSWVAGLGSGSLVVVDEAGLADSPSLARAVEHVLKVGASVRLVGDDQQLGAVGAGGLLRDLAARHGAVRLDDVVRFTDPAEAAASLALRDGRAEALGFYLDEHRVHVGVPTTAADQLFAAWTADRATGLDSLMLAPTRDLVADLNARARTARLDAVPTSSLAWEVTLADRNPASAGDTVITRTNDRRLTTGRESGRRWVRNGDRWLVVQAHPDGVLTVRSLKDEQTITLPADYVAASVELGYASTIHAAQGSTCDTVHGLLNGRETRAQLYTLLTRGRIASHVYLQLDSDAPTHELASSDAAPLQTATQVLERVLARDSDDRSATGARDDLHDPALRLPVEIDRYLDSLRLAAERTTSPQVDVHLIATAERLVPGLTDEPAWPTLRSELLLGAATGTDPAHRLTLAIAVQPLDDPDRPAQDRAALLHHHLVNRQAPPVGGPLPWLPPIADRLLTHPSWGPYLTARAALISDLAHQVGARTVDDGRTDRTRPGWTTVLPAGLQRRTIGDIAIWRASHRVPDSDHSPLGPPPTSPTSQRWFQHLGAATSTTGPEQTDGLLPPAIGRESDPFRSQFNRYLNRLTASGVDVQPALHAAAAARALPDDHPSAALWWRLHRHLPGSTLTASKASLGEGRASGELTPQADQPTPTQPMTREGRVDVALLVAGLLRLGQPRPLLAPPRDDLPAPRRSELLRVNELTLRYYQDQYPGSWSARYLAERCGTDLHQDPRFTPGHAPSGWTSLVDHLRRHDVGDQDMLDAGVARRAGNGHLIDLFRDRLVLPIRNTDHEVVAFVARRHDGPDHAEGGPKYLNTPTTALYDKSESLYGVHLLSPLSEPGIDEGAHSGNGRAQQEVVLVEGPIDAIAVNLAARDHTTGVAVLGTAVTDHQARLLARHTTNAVLGLDPDPAGFVAAERAFWTLTAANLDPNVATLPHGTDPAQLFHDSGADALAAVVDRSQSLGEQLARRAVRTTSGPELIDALVRISAARPPHTWAASLGDFSAGCGLNQAQLREQLLQHVRGTASAPTDRRHVSSTRRSSVGDSITSRPRANSALDRSTTAADAEVSPPQRMLMRQGPHR
ncbi:DNA primase, catalytic core [Microlunatus flavus]|uniref:DNA primase, catalytic core n=1 Tax=Microlunatus flavus TaxID=1036181 RepID=A0A1H9MWR1_9ACTN|nr:DNA primase, catalytic core [Microlunatus flavus]